MHAAETGGDVLQTRGQGWDRRSHAPVEPDQQKSPLSTGEGIQGRFQKVFGHIVVERPFSVAHGVLVQPAAPLSERPVKKLLGLAAKCPLENDRETPLELVLLASDQSSIVFVTEHFAERRDVPEQSARRLNVLHQAPQFDEGVLHRSRSEQQHRR